MPISSEFIELCQSQIVLLTQTLGAASVVVYLTERYASQPEAELIPVVAYPESTTVWPQLDQDKLPHGADDLTVENQSDRLRDMTMAAPHNSELSEQLSLSLAALPTPSVSRSAEDRLVLPLIHEEVVMGLLVTARDDRPWTEQERSQLEQVTCTLAIARFLDQQGQWIRQTLQQKRLSQHQQSDIFHNLLHQFRNPLTALKTFSKLLVKRFQPEDNNYTIASGIIRESDRLQELLQQFDAAVNHGDRQWQTDGMALPPEPRPVSEVSPPKNQLPAASSPTQQSLPLLPSAGLGADLTIKRCRFKEVLSPLLISAAAQSQEKQVLLRTAIEAELYPVLGDALALQEVLSNLIDNALKYAPAGSWIYVQTGLFQVQPQVRYQGVMIADSGPGIPEVDQLHIFERHYRGVQAAGPIAGTGLGLAIASDLITQMQGKIEVVSPVEQSLWLAEETLDWLNQQAPVSALGPGTAFTVWLPEALEAR
ncbi:MAG: GAF domain-containing protein [Leptolyngbya sp. SIO4C5]|nr:GAF domain-containing protein [Leptolyngbya sp. SIO4C5]